ncbi:4Fe-4S dicluster domain-containing protein [bacterium]|nr:4Fe-4S dicluster domain-containing protein [bacterium]
MDKERLVKALADAGVVGAGGGGFPAAVKLAADFEHYIANGAECEPLLHKDIELMSRYPEQIAEGLAMVRDLAGAHAAYFASKEKYAAVWERINPYLDKYNIVPKFLEDIYPAGDEFEVVWRVLGRAIPPGEIPLSVGAAVNNVETIYNIRRALDGEPVITKFLTVTGEVERPFTAPVPIGMEFSELIEFAKPRLADFVVIEGGPMMGKIVPPDGVVKKTTAGILILPPEHKLVRHRTMPIEYAVKIAASACMQCQSCTDLCPRHLLGHPIEPHKIMRSMAMPLSMPVEWMTAAMLCSECGVCEQFACPMGLSPRKINAELKRKFRENGIKFQPPGGGTVPKPEREFRKIPSARLAERLGILDYYHIHPEFMPALPEPERVKLVLRQGAGAPSVPVVKVGDRVQKGQLVASAPKNSIGANIHSPIDGTVASTADAIRIEK